jgi:hypothetical protein
MLFDPSDEREVGLPNIRKAIGTQHLPLYFGSPPSYSLSFSQFIILFICSFGFGPHVPFLCFFLLYTYIFPLSLSHCLFICFLSFSHFLVSIYLFILLFIYYIYILRFGIRDIYSIIITIITIIIIMVVFLICGCVSTFPLSLSQCLYIYHFFLTFFVLWLTRFLSFFHFIVSIYLFIYLYLYAQVWY